VLLTLLIYAPTITYGFVWDDFDFVVENYRVQGLSAAHWKTIWLYPSSGLYSPIHHMLLALLYQIGGLKPAVYHAAQVALHAACACALFTVLKRVESGVVGGIATALFVVHPANIENVAWVTETKSTLALLFFLISFLFFLRYSETDRARYAIFCALLFALSLLSKASTIVAPAVLLLFAWQKKSLTRACAGLIGVLFVLAIAQTLLTLRYQTAIGVLAAPDRLADATLLPPGAAPLENIGGYYGGRAIHLLNLPGFLFFYLKTAVWPSLSVWQMFPLQTGWTARSLLLWAAFLSMLAVLAFSWFSGKGRSVAFWGLWFLIFLAPVLQIVPNPIWVADRYLYISAIGMFVLFAKAVATLSEHADDPTTRRVVFSLSAAVIVAFTWVTTRHLPGWKSDVALWTSAMSTCERSAYCHGMLSLALRREAREARGEQQIRLRQAAVQEALRGVTIRPTPQKFVYLGDALLDAGDPRAVNAYLKTGELRDIPFIYWVQVAKAHYRFGNLAEATRIIQMLEQASRDDPSLLLVKAFVLWKHGELAAARQAIEKIMDMNRLYPQVPDRTRRFVTHYWGNAEEAEHMLLDVQAP